MLIGAIALAAALGGTASALPGSNQIDGNDIKRGAVKTQALHHRAVTTQKLQRQAVRGGKLARNAVKSGKIRDKAIIGRTLGDAAVTEAKVADAAITGAKVADDSIGTDKLRDQTMFDSKRLSAANGGSFDAARAAASPTQLYAEGQLSLYAKCFTDDSSDTTHAYVYAATNAAGALLASGEDSLLGDPFLDPGTDEEDREVWSASTGNDAADGFRNQFQITAADGTAIHGLVTAYAKNGALPGGNGQYGDGDACLVSGFVFG
jgi:hypothetical protein